ncbi:hypothetical protein BC938DRAFT_475667 [Jimgerdemannia flammicorona]|uniref:Exportin-T n=1 Tax=Jimgerdemannia flammicorona TaxID=994334 RepID=A0A433PQD3_9FUNG|nr:hypothetical protein BC938DRAFT_475667 [Jimgerdemannia flammicorona]
MPLCASNTEISTYPHPSVPLQFFENAVRYYQFFEIRPEGIPDVLEAFVDTRGLHHSMRQIRSRSWYLFHRFVKFLRPKMGNYVEIVLGSIQDLLVIQAELPAPSPSGTDSNISANNSGSTFDSQLYLFEAVGMLISHEAIPAEKQVKYLEAVLNPLVKGIQENMSKEMYNPEDELFPLQLHHLIMAIGSVAKASNRIRNLVLIFFQAFRKLQTAQPVCNDLGQWSSSKLPKSRSWFLRH